MAKKQCWVKVKIITTEGSLLTIQLKDGSKTDLLKISIPGSETFRVGDTAWLSSDFSLSKEWLPSKEEDIL